MVYNDVNGTGRIDYTTTTTSNISANAWHHYALICDHTSTNFKLYVDSVLIQTDSSVNGFNHNNLTSNNLGDTFHVCVFLFDDFRIYSSALQASDITSLYQLYSKPGVFIPALHYSFDQWTSGATIINEGTLGSSFDATLSNSA